MPPTDPLPRSDILLVVWRHELKLPGADDPVDPVWNAVETAFSITGRPRSYGRRADRYRATLQAQKLYQEFRGARPALHPSTEDWLGRYHHVTAAGKTVCVFSSEVRLNTSGPSMPTFDVVRQLLDDARPRLVLSVGLGGGVMPNDQVGDVVVSASTTFRLRGELDTSDYNGTTWGGAWAPSTTLLAGLSFPQLREPALIPPSPNYATSGPLPQPAPHQPTARIETKPVMTAPLVTAHGFLVGAPSGNAALGGICCGTDMDAGAAAVVCTPQGGTPIAFGAVVGLTVPALTPIDLRLRNGWITVFTERFAEHAATNAARTAHQICLRA